MCLLVYALSTAAFEAPAAELWGVTEMMWEIKLKHLLSDPLQRMFSEPYPRAHFCVGY